MGLEPTTATLATWRSTTELHPHDQAVPGRVACWNYKYEEGHFKGDLRAAIEDCRCASVYLCSAQMFWICWRQFAGISRENSRRTRF